jgi:nitrite reductase/ring-hydroxylating ferredoxin subunit/uncharacterized membrane protein
MDSEKIVDLIEEQEWVGPVADSLQAGVKTALDAFGPASQPIRNYLHGTWLGHALHPVLTDIPLGAWTVAAVLDIAETFGCESAASGADAAVAIGLLGALGAAKTGLADWHVLSEENKPKKVGAFHALLNISATLLYGASLILRTTKHRGLGRLLAGAGYSLVGASAYLGGILVYDLKIGVDHADRDDLPNKWVAVIGESELEEGKPKCAKVGELEVVLVKQGKEVKALGNLCSHLAGPLCEGEVKDGTIVCPWHMSRFDLTSGAVIDGPATAGQPAFKTRVVDGQVEIRYAS